MDFSPVSNFLCFKKLIFSGYFRSITYNGCHFQFSTSDIVWEYYKRYGGDVQIIRRHLQVILQFNNQVLTKVLF